MILKGHMKKYIKEKESNWWDYFEFKEPKAQSKNKIKKFFKYALFTFIIVGLIILLLF